LDVLEDGLFAASFAIEEDDFVDLNVIRIEIEEEAVPAYDNLFPLSCRLKYIFSDAASDIFH
jgi:hypothetical protein